MRSAGPASKQSRADLFLAGARRFAVLLGVICGATVAGAALIGLAAGTGFNRAVTVGLYLVGCFLLVGGFFVGNWGPVRLRSDDDGGPAGRKVRWASRDERVTQLNESAILICVGFALIVIAVMLDDRTRLL
jgi:hypothetical protein